MKIIKHTKPYSWLQWPIKMVGDNLENKLHITAKYFGAAKIDASVVIEKISNLYPLQEKYRDVDWTPVIFDEIYFVLELTQYPLVMERTHELFSLIEDDYPEYRPHISVSGSLWDEIKNKNLKPKDLQLTFGEIELWLGTPNE